MLSGVFLLFHQDVVPYLAQKYHEQLGVKYLKIEGTLFYGVRIDGLSYGDALSIQHLELEYNLLKLLRPTPKLDRLFVDGVTLDTSKLTKSESSSTSPSIPAFFLEELSLQNVQAIIKDEAIAFNLQASAIDLDDTLDVGALDLELTTRYADIQATGDIKDSQLSAKTAIKLAKDLREKYLAGVENFPQELIVDILLDQEGVTLQTQLDDLSLKEKRDMKLQHSSLRIEYPFAQDKIFIDSSSKLLFQDHLVTLEQKGSVDTKGAFVTSIEGEIEDLFAQKILLEASGDANHLDIAADVDQHHLKLNTTNYRDFNYHVKSPYLYADGLVQLKEQMQTLQASLELQNVDPRMRKLELFVEHTSDLTQISVESLLMHLKLQREGDQIEGGGSVASNYFHLVGDMNKQELVIYSEIQSLHTFLLELGIVQEDQELRYDAKLHTATTLFLKEEFLIKSKIEIPWYQIQLDDESIYQGENISMALSYQKRQLFIDSYTMSLQEHKIFSTKASKISLQRDQDIILESVYINNDLKLTGRVSPLEKKAQLHLQSDSFMYDSKDVNLTLAVDVDADIEFGGKQKLQGEITILGGVLSYMPKEDYKITDKDIIILQDIKEKVHTQREIDIKINAAKPIRYKNENIDLEFIPELQLLEQAGKPLVILGTVAIERGEVNVSDRVFEFDKSELSFNGTEQINPQLNLKLHHYTLDGIDIQIYITNTMDDPVIIFSSNPAMSQEDILSYILFGERASSVFDTSGDGDTKASVSALLLGSGLKQMLNQSNLLKVDTLNILTNEEGTLGYEIGAKLDKDFRIVYKNDTVSSVILQYSISNNIRLDVDVDETGQGVSILYIKDFSLRE